MSIAFSRLMNASEGRYLTPLEEELSVIGSMELPQRNAVSRMLCDAEYNIVDYATHAFCDIMPDFEGPKGSVRRKKGHQDGRIMLRYIAQAVREGSSEIFFEKVLSWLMGHLDERNVSGYYMEVFVHFIHQGARREIPSNLHGFIDPVFEEVVDFMRRSSHSGAIQRAHRRIAEFAVKRIMEILPDVKATYGAASAPKCKRDFELLTKEVARVLKVPSQQEMNRQFANWLVDRLMNQVEYDHKVWKWSFLSLREAVVHCCGPEAGDSVSVLFETMADRSEHLALAVELATAAGEIASDTAESLIDSGEPLGLLRKDEFNTNVSMVNREVIVQLAVTGASGAPDEQTAALAQLWCHEVIVKLPSRHTNFLAANLRQLLESAKKFVSEPAAEFFRDSVMRLVAVARRTETTDRLANAADSIASGVAEWAIDALGNSPAASRSCYRDTRLALARVASLLPAGPSSVNGHHFRRYLTQYVLPNDPATFRVMEQAYRKTIELVNEHFPEEDARLIRTYFEDSIGCFERYSRISGIRKNISQRTIPAVERGYQANPRHESLKRHGIEAGQRDGAFVLEKSLQAAVISGPQAERDLQASFLNEQIRLSKLPGGMVVEFVRGLQEQVRDYPEVVELLVGLAKVAPAYTCATRLSALSNEIAEHISHEAITQSPGYRDRIGEGGLEACRRDNSVMIRGLAHWMRAEPNDVMPFRDWWMRRIGRNIRNLPEAADSSDLFSIINVDGILQAVERYMDQEEINYLTDYLHRVQDPTDNQIGSSADNRSRNGKPIVTFNTGTPLTFSDIGV